MLTGSAEAVSVPAGNLVQTVSGEPYRQRRVRLSAAMRVEGPNTQLRMWLRLERADGSTIVLDNGADRQVTSPGVMTNGAPVPVNSPNVWTHREIERNVPPEVSRIVFGFLLSGPGRAWIDEAALDITAALHDEQREPPHPLTDRGLENLTAFAKLYGYVRYFHPSDQASRMSDMQWENFVVDGLRKLEPAASDRERAGRLAEVFALVAPSVNLYAAGSTPPGWLLEAGPMVVQYKSHSAARNTKSESPAEDDPPAPFQANLAPGLMAQVPLSVYADEAGTLPHSKTPELQLSELTPENRAARLAAVIIAWNVLQHFYPYFDVTGTDWPKALRTALQAAATDSSGRGFLSTLRRMIAVLNDGHGRVTWDRSPPLVSPVGWDWVEGRLVVTDVPEPHGQAMEAGDMVVTINGKPVGAAISEAEAEISAATPQWRLARALGVGLHYGNLALGAIWEGPPTEPLVLEIEPFRQPSTRRTVALPRSASSRKPVREARPAPIAELKPGILYVDLTRINDSEWKALLPRMEKSSGLLFDVRGYPGNLYAQFLCNLSRTPLKSELWQKPESIAPDHDMRLGQGDWTLAPLAPYLNARKVFLTDGRAISYAETVMGIVEHYRLGDIVGGPTAGTNGNALTFRVPGGYSIHFTAQRMRRHDGTEHHGVGIAPTVTATRTLSGVAAGRDEVLEQGLALFTESKR
jgi:hypothetical protein